MSTNLSNALTPSMLFEETAAADIPTPDAGAQRLFVDTDHIAKTKNSSATVSPLGGGDVVGPASAVDDRVATFDGTSGKLLCFRTPRLALSRAAVFGSV
jgi:hypothetical protein